MSDPRSTGLTVHDIARLAGVSSMTVSRAFNTPEKVSVSTLEKVKKVVAQTGYVPNGMASSLRRSSAKLIAAVLPTLSGAVFQETVGALAHALEQSGYQLIIGQTGYQASREDELLNALIRRRPDGIVVVGIMHSLEGRRMLLSSGIPVVETWDLTPTPIDMLVGFSHERIGESVCKYLASKGYRRLALLTASDERAQRRVAGFRRAAAEFHIEVPAIIVDAPTTLASGRAALAQTLSQFPQTQAVFCSSDMLALGVLIEANSRRLDIPRDLAVVGLGDIEFAQSLDPPLTTVRIDGTQMGKTAAQLIISRSEGRPIEQTVIDIGFEIVVRGSA